MSTNVACKICGHQFAVPEVHAGRQISCPSCQSPLVADFQAPAASTGAQLPSGRMVPPSRTLLAPLEEPIRFSCPKCKKSLESPQNMAGQKLNCPDCGQRLQIPFSAATARNKTILAVEESNPLAPPPSAAPKPAPPPLPAPVSGAPVDVEVVHEVARPRTEHCLECGTTLAGRETLLTCPDCGSVLCSSRCFREHRRFAHEQRKRKRGTRTTGFQCSYCGSQEPPYYTQQISGEGWAVFVLMLVFCFPLFWIGLLMQEERRHCYDCGARLS